MKLNIPVHYQMGNPLQQGGWPCDLHIQSYLQFNIRYEKVERPAPVGGALVNMSNIIYYINVIIVFQCATQDYRSFTDLIKDLTRDCESELEKARYIKKCRIICMLKFETNLKHLYKLYLINNRKVQNHKSICKNYNEMNDKKYHSVGTVTKSSRKIVETDKIDTSNTWPLTFLTCLRHFSKKQRGKT